MDLPAGIDSGQRVRVSGRGHAGALGGPAGDLYVLVNVEEDRRFERHGDDLITKLDVPFTDAALGGSLPVPTIEGEEEVEVSPGTQPGAILRLRERGLPSLRGRRRGDLHVVMNVLIPSNLDDDQRDLLRRFADSTNGDTYEARPGRACSTASGRRSEVDPARGPLPRRAGARPCLPSCSRWRPSGVEQIDAPDGLEGVVEYAVYGARGELPELGGLDAVAGAGRVEVRADEVPDDWTERWKRFYFPVLIGGRLYVRPPWEEPAQRGGVEEVVIDPGGAFGTGTHPTTRMCLELLLEADGRGSFCDLGCGSGVLAIAASKLGFEPVLGVDADRAALDETCRNARANGVEVEVRHVDLRREAAPVADAVAANLTARPVRGRGAVVGEARRAARHRDRLGVPARGGGPGRGGTGGGGPRGAAPGGRRGVGGDPGVLDSCAGDHVPRQVPRLQGVAGGRDAGARGAPGGRATRRRRRPTPTCTSSTPAASRARRSRSRASRCAGRRAVAPGAVWS